MRKMSFWEDQPYSYKEWLPWTETPISEYKATAHFSYRRQT